MWNHRPVAAELLGDRIGRDWRPTPSRLRDGERVLGYAACVVTDEHRRR
ncbi:MAG: hypothetical protein ACJ79A_17850 [Gemmatimonadaceae bacterium]